MFTQMYCLEYVDYHNKGRKKFVLFSDKYGYLVFKVHNYGYTFCKKSLVKGRKKQFCLNDQKLQSVCSKT